MITRDIFQRELAGQVMALSDPEYPKIGALITDAQRIIAEMNTGYREPREVRALFNRLTERRSMIHSGCCRRSTPTLAGTYASDATCSSITRASSWTAAASPSRTMCSSAQR